MEERTTHKERKRTAENYLQREREKDLFVLGSALKSVLLGKEKREVSRLSPLELKSKAK